MMMMVTFRPPPAARGQSMRLPTSSRVLAMRSSNLRFPTFVRSYSSTSTTCSEMQESPALKSGKGKILTRCQSFNPILQTERNSVRLFTMKQQAFKDVNNCLNTNIYSYLEASGCQSSSPYLNAVDFFKTRVNQKSVAVQDSCFPALVSNMCSSITYAKVL